MTGADSESDELLSILHAHGQRFLESFSFSGSGENRKCGGGPSARSITVNEGAQTARSKFEEDEEWMGCDAANSDDDSEGLDGDFDDNFTSSHPTNVLTYSHSETIPSPSTSRAQMKTFMSSKVSRTRENIPGQRAVGMAEEEDEEDERTNTENDAMLHHLVHTQLLSGSLKPDFSMTAAQRRKALAGRVLELSGGAKLGKGEAAVRTAERNKAARHVRFGILEKQKERGRQQLEQAKDLGNYHPTIKKLFKPSHTPSIRKRERGLKMGIGRFKGGILKLSREEINAVQNIERSPGHGASLSRKGKRIRR